MRTPKEYYEAIIESKNDMEQINWILNKALKDPVVPSSKENNPIYYNYLISVAKSLGFTFAEHWRLL